jgi:hypothetical protein
LGEKERGDGKRVVSKVSSNTQFNLREESVDKLTGFLTMLAQMLRATRQHDEAAEVEAIRKEIQTQFYS